MLFKGGAQSRRKMRNLRTPPYIQLFSRRVARAAGTWHLPLLPCLLTPSPCAWFSLSVRKGKWAESTLFRDGSEPPRPPEGTSCWAMALPAACGLPNGGPGP